MSSNKKNIEQIIKNLIGDAIKSSESGNGCELWDVAYYNSDGEWLLEIVIDKPEGGISFDDCEKVTRLIEPIIDRSDPIESSYSLVVSSPGLNRELKTDLHLNKYINKKVAVKLFVKPESLTGRNFNAVLAENSEDYMVFYDVENPENQNNNKSKKSEKSKDKSEQTIYINQTEHDLKLKLKLKIEKKDIAHVYAYDEIKF
jgi:ribosome maturation factor RimP